MLRDEVADRAAAGAAASRVMLGDPVPRFVAQTITGVPFDLTVAAGRWIVLCFLGSPSDRGPTQELGELLQARPLFDEDHLVVHGVFTEPPADPSVFASLGGAAMSFFADYDAPSPAPSAGAPAPWCSIRCCVPSPIFPSTIRPGMRRPCVAF